MTTSADPFIERLDAKMRTFQAILQTKTAEIEELESKLVTIEDARMDVRSPAHARAHTRMRARTQLASKLAAVETEVSELEAELERERQLGSKAEEEVG